MLQLEGISKEFSGTRALKNVSLRVGRGECVGLIGENGAGKSTLIRILAGVHQADSGQVTLDGQPRRFSNPREALAAGIATIHQELAGFEKLTVSENLLLAENWPRYPWGGTRWQALHAEAQQRLQAFGLNIPPERFFYELGPAQRQEVAIARALACDARLLILDEPTASLTEPEVERLFNHLEKLKARGIGLLYVSHRLDEILHLTDRVVVLRDGEQVATYPTREATIERMVRDMVGRELQIADRQEPPSRGSVALELRQFSHPLFHDVSLSLHRGEILGLAGLVGAGRSEIARAVFGLYAPRSGSILVDGKERNFRNAAEARAAGIAYLPEERKRHGLVLEHSVGSSISIGLLRSLSRLGVINARRERDRVSNAIDRFKVRTSAASQPIGTLSGGNQQKAMLARWLEGDPQIIILDEPTRGVDVGAKAEIHRLIRQQAEQGKAVLLISSDLPELLALSHRIIVLHKGVVAAEYDGDTATQEEILLAASGLREMRGNPAAV